MPAFVPEPFATPVVSPDTATLFRRAPYISPSEYKQTPTAVAVTNLVPGREPAAQEAALAGVISRASDWVDTICFHRADGTLAASPSTESGWIRPKDNGTLQLICNYKPILEVDALALGVPGQLGNIGQTAAETLTISGQVLTLPNYGVPLGLTPNFPVARTVNGRVYVVWSYVSGFPHTSLAVAVTAEEIEEEEAKSITVAPSVPGGSAVYGIYPGTQLTIHDGAATEVVVVASVAGLVLTLVSPLLYEHKLPAAPDTTRVSAVPWIVEQATISLVSNLIKMRGTRAMVIPTSPAKATSSPKQSGGQAGAQNDFEAACKMLAPFTVPYLRST